MAARLAILLTDVPGQASSAGDMLRLPIDGVSEQIEVTTIGPGHVAVARASGGGSTIRLERTDPSGRWLWVVGVPIASGGSVDRRLDLVMSEPIDAAIDILTALDGAFAAVLWDEPSARFVIVTDFAGLQPLYVRSRPGALAFATSIAGLARCGETYPDPAGWGAFVAFGHFIGERTSASDITRVAAASVLEYAGSPGRLTSRTYWRWPEVKDPQTRDVDTSGLLAQLAEHIDAYMAHRSHGTLLLSGGFESRLLAALLTSAGWAGTALTVNNPYEHHEIDGRFARAVARELGVRQRTVTPAESFFSTPAFLEYVRASDVATTSVNLFIAYVCNEIVRSGATAIWDGVGYGVVIKDKSAPDLDAYVQKAMARPESPAWTAARQVFSRTFVDAMIDGVADSVRRERDACFDGPAGVAQFFVRNRARNRTTPNPLKVYAPHALPLMPGLSKQFYECVAALPPALKKDNGLYRLIFERHFPRLARLPFCSAGRLLPGSGAPTWMYRLLSARSRVVEHHRVGDWMRRSGVTPVPARSRFVDAAVRDMDAGDPRLNAEGIGALTRTRPTGSIEDTTARELVFYWSAWHAVMRQPSSRTVFAGCDS